jgi:hypothetical protein
MKGKKTKVKPTPLSRSLKGRSHLVKFGVKEKFKVNGTCPLPMKQQTLAITNDINVSN